MLKLLEEQREWHKQESKKDIPLDENSPCTCVCLAGPSDWRFTVSSCVNILYFDNLKIEISILFINICLHLSCHKNRNRVQVKQFFITLFFYFCVFKCVKNKQTWNDDHLPLNHFDVENEASIQQEIASGELLKNVHMDKKLSESCF